MNLKVKPINNIILGDLSVNQPFHQFLQISYIGLVFKKKRFEQVEIRSNFVL
jgi:hypothetical protein